MTHSALPPGKRFAFTVVDDTDHSTIENVGPVYRLLSELGLLTTKTVWTVAPTEPNRYDGSATAAEPEYRDFCRSLQADGFELASHGATMHSSKRADTEVGLQRFGELFGALPRMHINHFKNRENLYWGQARVSGGLQKAAYRVASRAPASLGHVEGSEYFWGDLCREHVDYVRSFTYRETNLARLGGPLVYEDCERPYAKRMFISTEGGDLESFLAMLTDNKQDRLEEAGGICIMYTHFGDGFVQGGRLDPRFERAMRRLAGKPGWFVPASEMLDAVCQSECPAIDSRRRNRLERRWLRERLRHGPS